MIGSVVRPLTSSQCRSREQAGAHSAPEHPRMSRLPDDNAIITGHNAIGNCNFDNGRSCWLAAAAPAAKDSDGVAFSLGRTPASQRTSPPGCHRISVEFRIRMRITLVHGKFCTGPFLLVCAYISCPVDIIRAASRTRFSLTR